MKNKKDSVNHRLKSGEQGRQQPGFLLQKIAVLLILVVLPLIVRLHVYEITQDEFFFLTEDMTFYDFFCWGKEFFLILVCGFLVLVLMDWAVIEGKRILWNRAFYFYLAFLALGLVCSVLSGDPKTAFLGNYQKFEGLAVLVCYGVIAFWGYQIAGTESLLDFAWKCVLVLAGILAVLGLMQAAGKDPFLSTVVQKWIIPSDYQEELLGMVEPVSTTGAVYLTMANANYAGILLAMLCILLCGVFSAVGAGWEKIVTICLILANLVCLIRTNSRIGIVMLMAAGVIGVWLFRKELLRRKKQAAAVALVFLVIFGIAGMTVGKTLFSRIALTVQSFSKEAGIRPLEAVFSEEDGLHIDYNGRHLILHWRPGDMLAKEGMITDEAGEDLTALYSKETGTFAEDSLAGLTLYTAAEPELDESVLVMEVRESLWRISWLEGEGYQLYLGSGSFCTLEKVERWGNAGLQHLASGRLYIWEHALPLLKRYGLLGSGPDTFFKVYPQQDFVGKTNYSNGPLAIVEKAHNQYLGTAIEMGIPALLCWLVFFGSYLAGSIKAFRAEKSGNRNRIIFLVILAYLAALQFNDSHMGYSVLVYFLLGVGMRRNQAAPAADRNQSEMSV